MRQNFYFIKSRRVQNWYILFYDINGRTSYLQSPDPYEPPPAEPPAAPYRPPRPPPPLPFPFRPAATENAN